MNKSLFDPHAEELSQLLIATKTKKNKTAFFLDQGGRNIIFRLEALCRMHRETTDKKFFDIWYKKFKSLEDLLGQMDHSREVMKFFSDNDSLKRKAEKLFTPKYEKASEELGKILADDGWLFGSAMESFKEGLMHVAWHSLEEAREQFILGMCQELDKLVTKYEDGEINLWHLEEGLHEFRRRLRWVSIYASVSNGMIQLKKSAHIPEDLRPYCTKEITSSPFNKMPANKSGTTMAEIRTVYYYPMSWLIGWLGEIKDAGQMMHAFEQMQQDKKLTAAEMKKSSQLLSSESIDELCMRAEEQIDRFIYEDRIPEKIIRDLMRNL